MFSHYAYFDTLAICFTLPPSLKEVAELEVHLFSYLSCLLSLYDRRPSSSWEYRFGVTRGGFPFSTDIDAAIDKLVFGGKVVRQGEYLVAAQLGKDEFSSLSLLSMYAARMPYIRGACSSVLTLTLGSIRQAIYQEPDIKTSRPLSQARLLLTEEAQDYLYEQFAALSEVIGINVRDLMVPSVVWLTYLADSVDTKASY